MCDPGRVFEAGNVARWREFDRSRSRQRARGSDVPSNPHENRTTIMKTICFTTILAVGVWSTTANPAWKQKKTNEEAQSGSLPSNSIVIARPGVVAVDAPARRDQLTSAGALAMCAGFVPTSAARVLDTVDAPGGYGLDERYTRIAENFRRLGAGCLRGLESACAEIQDGAMAWARESELGGPKGNRDSGLFANTTMTVNMRLLAPMIAALGVAEQFSPLGSTNRRVLDPWLRQKVDEYEHGRRGAGSYRAGKHGTTARRAAHNHAVQSSLAAMSYGAWANDAKYFKTGVDQWFITLESMRRNGSLPIETRRGARALFYHGRTLSALMQLAERASVQGIDLYAYAPNKEKTIHRAVAFFINAVEDPELVLRYARTNKSPGPSKNYKVQDLGGTGSTMGWIAPYANRFPDHANTRRLMARRLRGHSEPRSYLTSQLDQAVVRNGFSAGWTGVDARCFYADPKNG